MTGFTAWLQQLRLDTLLDYLISAAAALLSIAVHETCHGLAAYWMGDDTAKEQGRLSLNPLRHIDPVGLLMMVVFHFGWAKPVQVNAARFRDPKVGMAITALAGPVSNLLLGILALMLMTLCQFLSLRYAWLSYAGSFFSTLAAISLGLFLFNLIPIPPLDGSKVLFAVLPDRAYLTLMRYERYGMILLVLLLVLGVLDGPLSFLMNALLNGLFRLLTPYIRLVYHLLF